MIKKKILVVIVCVAFLLSGCSPRLVGEKKAKEAGLAFINKVFDVNETEAVVEYAEYANENSETENAELKSDAPLSRIYTITVKDNNTGEDLYSAQVSATTGFAYSADRSNETLSPLTDAQLQQSKELSQLPWGEEEMMNRIYESKPAQTVYEWVTARFEKQDQVMRTDDGSMEGDFNGTHRVLMDSLVTFDNGAVYVVGITWPTMEITRVEILSQPVMKGEQP